MKNLNDMSAPVYCFNLVLQNSILNIFPFSVLQLVQAGGEKWKRGQGAGRGAVRYNLHEK